MQKQTNEQNIASNPSHCVWVAASAGTGKTKILTDRVLRLMLSGSAPEKILCLTFTKAAAAEMSSRINTELCKWAIADDEKISSSIQALTGSSATEKIKSRARSLFMRIMDSELKIQTIHSFCQSILKRFPLEAGVAPHFRLIDEITSAELIQESWIRVISQTDVITQKDKDLKKAIEYMARSVHDATFSHIVHEVVKERILFVDFISEPNGVERLIKRIYEKLGVESDDSAELIKSRFRNIDGIDILCKAMYSGGSREVNRAYIIERWLMADSDERIKMFLEYSGIFLKKDGTPKKISSILTKSPRERYPETIDIISQEQTALEKVHDKIKSIETALITESLIHISEAVTTIYKKLKDSRAFLDYDDLIMICANLFMDKDNIPWIMYKLDGGIDHILVDEAQDTSPEQWEIISSLCSEFFAGDAGNNTNRTLFVVGDEKQSIFSFQGADPKVFCDMQTGFAELIKNARKSWKSVSLDLSFRSAKPILHAVDAVFSVEQNRSAITAGEDEIRHVSHRSGSAGRVEVWDIVTSDDELERSFVIPIKRIERKNPKTILAKKIASKIKQWFSEKRILPSKGRAVTAGDIIILVRKRDDLVKALINAFEERSIKVAGTDRMILTDHIAVQDLIALGNFLLLPEDDLTLASVLKSPLVGMSEDELFDIAHNRGSLSMWESLKERSNDNNTEIYKTTFDYLYNLLNKVDFSDPLEFYLDILEVQSGRKNFISRLGTQVNDPLDEFLNLADTYNRDHTHSLQGFLSWITSGKTSIKRDFEEGKDEIRIMTVHGAKGLQAPIVFMPDTTALPKMHYGVLWKEKDKTMMWSIGDNKNSIYKQIESEKKQLQKHEYIRLLYVAMTRAEDELYICGYKGKKELSEDCWYNIAKYQISKIAEEDTSGTLTVSCEQKDEVISQKNSAFEFVNSPLPDFAKTLAPSVEKNPDTLTPSHQDDVDNQMFSPLKDIEEGKNKYERGNIIHKMLESYNDVDSASQNEIYFEAQSVRQKFPNFFMDNSYAEVPVSGIIGNKMVYAQIDRLVITESEALIIDYKTNRDVPESDEKVDISYIKQLSVYRNLISLIYPEKHVKCALLWTYSKEIMYLDDSLLDRYSITG